jgi:hypothetical protein
MNTHQPPQMTPLQRLYHRLELLGRLLTILCCLWVGVVANVLMSEAPPDLVPNHRSPAVQEQISKCEGPFSARFNCTDTILVKGGRQGAYALLQTLAATMLLPTVAWTMWHGVMDRARRLRYATPHAIIAADHGTIPHPPLRERLAE